MQILFISEVKRWKEVLTEETWKRKWCSDGATCKKIYHDVCFRKLLL